MFRFVVVLPLSPLAVGDSFSLRRWPLHVTVVPAFITTSPIADVAGALRATVGAVSSVTAIVGDEQLFGPRETLSVNLLEANIPLTLLHDRLCAALPGRFDRPEFTGVGYRPHITATRHERAHPGDDVLLSQLALVDMEPVTGTGTRAVVATVRLA